MKTALFTFAMLLTVLVFAQKQLVLDSINTKNTWRPIQFRSGGDPIISVSSNNDTVSFYNPKTIISIDGFKLSVDSLKRLINRKPDTPYVPLYERTDTLKASFVYGNDILKRGTGYALIKGFKIQRGKEFEWAQQPTLAGILDNSKRPVLNIVNGTLVINPPEEKSKQHKPKQ